MGARAAALLLACAATAAHAADGWSLDATLESRAFAQKPAEDRQRPDHFNGSLALAPEWALAWDDGAQEIVFEGFARYDASDDARSHADARELFWRLKSEHFELNAGVRRVFWGVTESAHLVDVVNQSDFVENPDNEDKLGQPMARLAWIVDPGLLEFFVLPYFRERPFPSETGRLRPFLPVRESAARYESGARERHLDGALRYTQSLGGWDLGLSVFQGTAREPRLLVASDGAAVTAAPDVPPQCEAGTFPDPLAALLQGLLAPDCEPYYRVSPDNPHLVPAYDQVRQYGLELQRLSEGWFLKLEAVHRAGRAQSFSAAVGGFEYTFGGVWESAVDLTAVLEYQWDERGSLDPDSAQGRATRRLARGEPFTIAEARQLQTLQPRSYSAAQNDVFAGMRVALNDEAGTEALLGAIVDLDHGGLVASVEAARRLGEDWKLGLESRWFGGAPVTDPLWSLRRDGYLQLELTRYF